MNRRIYERYKRFITTRQLRVLPEDCYVETHHIIPKCLGGSDNVDNLIQLSLREHYIAHMLLAKAYQGVNHRIVYAFVKMVEKNNVKAENNGERVYIVSRLYENLKIAFYQHMSAKRKGFVYCTDNKGNRIRISSDEYHSRDDVNFHTKGKIYCKDITTNAFCWIDVDEFYNDDKYIVDMQHYKIKIKNNVTHDTITVTYAEWENNYKKQRYRLHGKFKLQPLYTMVKTFDEAYIKNRKSQSFFYYKNKLTNQYEYAQYDQSRHITTTQGKVLAKDSCNNYKLITKEEYSEGGYTGHTKGWCKVFDKQKQKIVLITQEEFKQNKDRYEGHMAGKINVVVKETGEKMAIQREMYDSEIHCAAGNKKYLFKGVDLATKKERNINYFEFQGNPSQYIIIDNSKFNNIQLEMEKK